MNKLRMTVIKLTVWMKFFSRLPKLFELYLMYALEDIRIKTKQEALELASRELETEMKQKNYHIII